MLANEGQFDRVAAHLDGQGAELSAEHSAMARQVKSGEAWLAAQLATPLPREALERARRRMRAELAAPRHGVLFRIGTAAAAAAAAVLLAAGLALWGPWGGGEVAKNPASGGEEVVCWAGSLDPEDAEIAMLADEIDRLGAEMILPLPGRVLDAHLDALQQSIEEFWTETDSPDLG
jgi:hypothetical protein